MTLIKNEPNNANTGTYFFLSSSVTSKPNNIKKMKNNTIRLTKNKLSSVGE